MSICAGGPAVNVNTATSKAVVSVFYAVYTNVPQYESGSEDVNATGIVWVVWVIV